MHVVRAKHLLPDILHAVLYVCTPEWHPVTRMRKPPGSNRELMVYQEPPTPNATSWAWDILNHWADGDLRLEIGVLDRLDRLTLLLVDSENECFDYVKKSAESLLSRVCWWDVDIYWPWLWSEHQRGRRSWCGHLKITEKTNPNSPKWESLSGGGGAKV